MPIFAARETLMSTPRASRSHEMSDFALVAAMMVAIVAANLSYLIQ